MSEFNLLPQPHPCFRRLLHVAFICNDYELAWTAGEVHPMHGRAECLGGDDGHSSKSVGRAACARNAENFIFSSACSSAALRANGAFASEPDLFAVLDKNSSPSKSCA